MRPARSGTYQPKVGNAMATDDNIDKQVKKLKNRAYAHARFMILAGRMLAEGSTRERKLPPRSR
jgi:hypothetical protein